MLRFTPNSVSGLLRALMVLVVAVSVPLAAGAAASKTRHAKKKPAAVVKSSAAKPSAKGRAVLTARAAPKRSVAVLRPGKLGASRVRAVAVRAEPVRASFGQLSGLHGTVDPLDLKSSVALVLDQDTNEVLFSKNSQAVLPIASITKLMTAVVVTEAHLPLDEVLTVSQDDVDTEKGSSSRLRVGT